MEALRAADEAATQARARETRREADAEAVLAETLVADGAAAKEPGPMLAPAAAPDGVEPPAAPYNPFLR